MIRDFGPGAVAAILLFGGGALAVRFIMNARTTPAPRKVMQFTVVNVQPPAVRPPPPPPPPVQQPKEVEPARTRVDLKPTDFVPPEASRAPAGGGGRLSLGTEAQGAGDAFNLAGNPGGHGLLSGGGLGDGDGEGGGLGNGAGERFGWYYTQVGDQIEVLLRKSKALGALSARLEVRVWVDASRRLRVEPVKSDQDPRVLDALHELEGKTVRDLPPEGTPIPMILRITARRPQ
jgi:hypothetical protein